MNRWVIRSDAHPRPLNQALAQDQRGADSAALMARLDAALKRRFGTNAAAGNPHHATLGGSNRTVLFDLTGTNCDRRLVLRIETVPEDYTPFLPAAMQYRILEVVFRHGVPVPEPLFELDATDELGHGFVMAAVDGETMPKRLLNAPEFARARDTFLDRAGAILARLHSIDAGELALLESVPDSRDPLAAQMHYYDRYGEPHPVLEYAFRWLDRHRPEFPERSPLHGDFRTGNMIVDHDGIRAVLDWECAQLGDVHADLGWFCTRSWRFGHVDRPAGGFGSRESLFAAYTAAGGRTVDPEAVHWWEIFGLTRWAIYNIMQLHGHMSGRRRSPAFAACGRNTALIEYELLKTISGDLD